MEETGCPACTSFENATTWSAGCMATRTTFSASESSAGSTSPDLIWQGTVWSASIAPSAASSRMAFRRRPPATTA